MSRTKKKNEQKKKKDVTRTLRRKTMTPTAEEKRKSIHTRKTREFSRMRIAYLRQTSFNGKIAFLYVRVPTHFVYFCVYVYSLARARSSKKCDVLRENLSFFFSLISFLRSSRMIKRTRNWHLANFFHLMTSFFFDEHPRDEDEKCFYSSELCVWVHVCGC